MARPREFDINEALDAATEAFWARGYEATSMADLMQAMNLHKGSIYKAFGDKHQLFLAALGRYLDRGVDRFRTVLSGEAAPMEKLRRAIYGTFEHHAMCDASRGCLGLNTLVELGPHDAAVQERIQIHFGRLKQLLATTIADGQSNGTIRSDRSPEAVAEYLLAVINGIQAGSKGYMPPDEQRRVADLALASLSR